jgi:hypothetical protein
MLTAFAVAVVIYLFAKVSRYEKPKHYWPVHEQ